jgi:hypothetical protein
MADLLFGSLNSGELSPLLDGRVDKEFYQSGAKTLENLIPLVQGPIVQRSGTGFVKEVKASANRTAQIPFQFNVEQAYVLEFGDQYMRVLKDHAIVLNTGTTITGISQAATAVVTYAGADIFSNGDKVFIQSVAGMVEVNNREFTVANLNAGANTFELSGVNSTGYGAWTSGGTVAEIYEIATPYLQADLFDTDGTLRIKFAQTGDVMYLVHPSYAPRKLTRTGHAAWTLTTATFLKGPFSAPNGDDTIRVFCAATTYQPGDSVTVTANSAIFESGHAGMLFFMEEIYFDQLDVHPWTASIGTPAAGDQFSHDGNVYEKLAGAGAMGTIAPTHTEGDAWDNPETTANRAKLRYLHSRWAIVQLNTFSDTKNMTGTIVTYLCEGLDSPSKTITGAADNGSGLVRITSAAHLLNEGDYVHIASVTGTTEANGDWKIINVAANTFDLAGSVFANAYSAGGTAKRFATWKWAMGAFSAAKGYPGVVAFHDERLMLGATTDEPDTFWLSESGSYDSFAQRDANQIVATNAIRGVLANGQVNKMEWALSMDDGLVMGTASAEYLLQAASNSEPLGPGNFRAAAVSGYGSRGVQPVRVGESAFFVQRAGRKIRDMGYAPDPEHKIGTDMTVRAEHLFQASPVIAMGWVQEPDALLWCVHANGLLRAFTFQHEQTVYAWGRHILGGYSDSGQTAAPEIESCVSIPAPDGTQNELWLIVKRYIDGGTKRFHEYVRPRWTPSSDDYTPALEDAVMSDSSLTYDSTATATVSGLWHLRGQTVAVLADGKIHPNVVVDTGGKVTLNYTASVIQIGLPVRARFKSMRLETLTQTGTAQGKRKVVNKVSVRCIDTTGFKYGANFTSMKRKEFALQSQPLSQPLPLFSGDKTVDWPGEWGPDAFLCLENDKPVPFGVAAIFPMVEVAQS